MANKEIARSRKNGYWNPEFVDSISRQRKVKLALVYDSWVGHVLPKHWIKVASWRIYNNVVTGDDFVYFYAVDSTEALKLKSNIESFRSSLPSTVDVAFY